MLVLTHDKLVVVAENQETKGCVVGDELLGKKVNGAVIWISQDAGEVGLVADQVVELSLTRADRFENEGQPKPPSSPGESHPRALTEPYVTVARYTALVALVTRPWEHA
jgi:hypothetical protein